MIVNATNRRLKMIGAAWLAGLLVLVPAAAHAQVTRQVDAANRALAWTKTQQQPDGSFAGFGAGSTVDALLAIIAANQDPASYSRGGKTPVQFLESKAADLAKTPGSAGKLLLALAALGLDGKSFGGVDVVAAVNSSYDAGTGQYGKDAIGHAFAILGLKAAGQEVPAAAADFLESIQTPEGGWAFTGETTAGGADTNTTAVAVQALVASGQAKAATLDKAREYLSSQMGADGGFPYQKGGEFGSESDVNSTSYVLQAFNAMGVQTNRPLEFLLSMQKPGGAFQWKPAEPDDNAGATYQAIAAILGATLVSPRSTAQPVPSPEPGGGLVGPQPGMPRTGQSPINILAAAALLSLACLGVGAAARWNVRTLER
jgi:hypothetical protein